MSTDFDEDGLSAEQHGATLIATIDGGPLQLFGEPLARALERFVAKVEQDPAVTAVVFVSAHQTRFVSHADVDWLQQGGANFAKRLELGDAAPPRDPDTFGIDRLHALFLRMNSAPAVFVAALEGSALGLGAEFSWACDMRVMAADAFIGQPEILLGIMPGGGGSQRLSRLIGTHRALSAILEGRPLHAEEALWIGAADAAVERADVRSHALDLADRLGRRSKAAIGAIKRAIYFGASATLEDGLRREGEEFMKLIMSADGQAGMKDYVRQTQANGELPLYNGDRYARAIETGSVGSAPGAA